MVDRWQGSPSMKLLKFCLLLIKCSSHLLHFSSRTVAYNVGPRRLFTAR